LRFDLDFIVPIDRRRAAVRCANSCMNHPARIVRPESERRGCLPILNPWRPAIF
jgi:hypothetical protein